MSFIKRLFSRLIVEEYKVEISDLLVYVETSHMVEVEYLPTLEILKSILIENPLGIEIEMSIFGFQLSSSSGPMFIDFVKECNLISYTSNLLDSDKVFLDIKGTPESPSITLRIEKKN